MSGSAAVTVGGTNFTPVVHDYPQTGDQVHAALLDVPGLRHLHGGRHEQYRLDLFERD